jgi:translation initiation factor 2D
VFVSTTTLYSLAEVKELVKSYITSKSLTNPHNQAYINLDQTLVLCLLTKSAGKSKDKGTESKSPDLEFIKKDELTKKILEKMQSWYEVRVGHGDPVRK